MSPHIQRRASTYIKNTAETAMIDPSTATTTNGIAPNTPLWLLRESPMHRSFVAYAVGERIPQMG